ncbi:elongation factor P maturation arginine rhamnosyltransferase EarP [Azotobacter beijerinckii]|uniref:elongation factor P maturation arginine rhamnosyltransferase EarP n=1 Tax=Azotobacter beijerinckii TaxID=170623 RepID=UPI0029539F6D|nr:elongation factor P maturation arginine rhamnosyltransferase EarP [Azotobacter beijerinckii]MDV7212463.1 elongation factor P maturation arginine rhamnosyltransferase EarP [Azotobacter beijerinckii]
MQASWEIFCSVVDNYGDAGVTWRLARQLVAEHGQRVRLWIDDPAALVRLCPEADASLPQQWREGVEIRRWPADWQPVEPADVVVEAFACQLPEAHVAAMAARRPRVLWLNLEYLSAEDWVGGCHGLPSLQPEGLEKFFFFPGFAEGTGGLLRERGLIERRRAFQADGAARVEFLQALGVQVRPGERLVSLFAYENAGLDGWLEALAADATPTLLLVPEGRILGDLQRWLEVPALAAGAEEQRGALRIRVLPFVRQDAYDRLLWCCDFNAVRGEDSFLRAQWAGRPLLWQIYPQADGVHWDKLEAFLDRYLEGLSPSAAAALQALWRAWNAGEGMGAAWTALRDDWPELGKHAERWCARQTGKPDLAAALVQFYTDWL